MCACPWNDAAKNIERLQDSLIDDARMNARRLVTAITDENKLQCKHDSGGDSISVATTDYSSLVFKFSGGSYRQYIEVYLDKRS